MIKNKEGIASKYGLEFEKDVFYYSDADKNHQKFYDSYSSTYPGLIYVVTKAKFQKSSLQMWFRIEVEDNLYAGFHCLILKLYKETEI